MFNSREIALVGVFAALTAVGAQLRIPFLWVPLTLQLFFVFLAGIVLGPKLGALSQLIYLGSGLIGLPVFAEGGGPGYIFHPSFGYLIGFAGAAFVSGWLKGRYPLSTYRVFAVSLVALAVVYLIGVPYLYLVLRYVMGVAIDWVHVLKTGLLIFLPGDLLKVFLVSLLGPRLANALVPGD